MKPTRRLMRTSARPGSGVLITLLALTVMTGSAVALDNFTAAIENATSTFSAGTLQLEGVAPSNGSSDCYSTGSGSGGTVSSSNSGTCTGGSPLPASELSSSASSAVATELRSVGDTEATTGTVSSPACGVAELADTSTATQWGGTAPDTSLAFYGLTYQAAGPWAGSDAITLNGTNGWGETTVEYDDPQSFTIVAWVKTSTKAGAILGFSTAANPNTGPDQYDRMLWVDGDGDLVWGAYDGGVEEAVSSDTVTSGNWVFVAASIGSSGMAVYVDPDNSASGTNTAAPAETAENYDGYWSIGDDAMAAASLWTNIPSTNYFNGSLAQLAIIPSQLSASQVTTLYDDNSLSSFTTAVDSLGPANYWPLGDSGATPYLGSVPGVTGSTSICNSVELTVQQTVSTTDTCLYPAAGGSCPAPSASYLMGGFSSVTMTAPTSTAVSITIAMEETAAQGTSTAGLHVLPQITFEVANSATNWTATIEYATSWAEL